MLLIGFGATAQTSGLVRLKSTTTTKTLDTVTNTGARTQRYEIKGYNDVTFQTTITKISGTVAGTIGLYGSVDGVAYSLIGSTQTPTNVASQTLVFPQVATTPYQYFQVTYTGAGTMSASFSTPALYRQRQ